MRELLAVIASVALSALLVPAAATAQRARTTGSSAPPAAVPSGAPVTSEAQLHFERGLGLSDDGNYAAAMVEFRYAYRITRNPLLLYNIGLAQQALGHYVEALEAMRAYQADAGAQLPPARQTAVQAAIDRLETRVGTLVVPLDLPGLDVRVDGVPCDANQARTGLRLAVGTHLVTVRATNYQTRQSQVDIVSSITTRLEDVLMPVISGITVDSNVVEADILVDGQVVGRTPDASVLPVPFGRHHLEVRRAGYSTFGTDVDVSGPGSRVTAQLTWLDPMPADLGTHLHIDGHPHGTHGTRSRIDGRPINDDGRDALPPGVHHLAIEAEGFTPVEQDVRIEATQTRRVEAWLYPTPAQAARLEAWRSNARGLSIAGGALLLIGAGLTALGVLRSQVVADTTAWNYFVILGGAPIMFTGLIMGLTAGIRYLTTPTPNRFRPPTGHQAFSFGAEPPPAPRPFFLPR